ncbi:hypothetical protein NDN08_005678 [Rhodosorus marinus]|uniref:Coiled-coil domain-containing protein 86 n=1 Tax=Rhodosorus marinus TaxID=101924 RepID=A0AAV8V4N3_9RHOD|nr:hypothetical protein NDN08_005678 [Rhodosorus marinus]
MTNEKGGRELLGKEVGKVPSRGGARPWRAARKQRYSSVVNVPSLKLSVEKRREQRAKKKALSAAVKEKKEEERAAKEAERDRLRQKRKTKEENRLRSSKSQMVTNPKTIKKMSKKQLKKLVRV